MSAHVQSTFAGAPFPVKLLVYKTLCRLITEYSSKVWDPHMPHTLACRKTLRIEQLNSLKTKKVKKFQSLIKRPNAVQYHFKTEGNSREYPCLSKLWLTKNHFQPLTNTHPNWNKLFYSIPTPLNTFNTLSCDTSQYLQSFLLMTSRKIKTGEAIVD